MNSGPDPSRILRRTYQRNAAFSLVEIALALGIMAFALVSVFGLIPLGLSTFRKAADISVGSQIAQTIIGESQQADFDALVETHAGSTDPFTKSIRYFDYQGAEQAAPMASSTLYWVNTRVIASTTMGASTASGSTTNQDIATVTVQVATNPGNVAPVADGKLLWATKTGVPVMTFSAYVARSSPVVQPTP